MRICIVGKFPPIEGGVSMQTYWSAHRLAQRGHEVHVVTNAKEVRPPFRMHMRPEDWRRCEGSYGMGSVFVHWTAPVDESQFHIPMASPFVTKLAAVAASLHAEHPFDVIFSFYMEPYAVAGHLAAEIARVPHVVRMAGSDAGRLWLHPQFEALYDHVLRSADIIIGGGQVARRAIERGIDPARIASLPGLAAPDTLFGPDGPLLDIAALRAEIAGDPDPEMRNLLWGGFTGDRPYFGLCGKLGDFKGSFPLLAAMQRLKQDGLDVGLVALAHGKPPLEDAFRARVDELGLTDRVLQLPFLPHWRVPDFLRGCLAVCCLEQDFPVVFHTPTIPIEVLLNGNCLVGSTEVIRKLPSHERLPDRYGCVAIEDVNDVLALSSRLAAIVRDSFPVTAMGARGRDFAVGVQRNWRFDQRLEHILISAAERKRPQQTAADMQRAVAPKDLFPLAHLAAIELSKTADGTVCRAAESAMDLVLASSISAELERAIELGETRLAPLLPGVRLEIAVAQAEEGLAMAAPTDPLYRLQTDRWAITPDELQRLYPVADTHLRTISFDHDITPYGQVRTLAELPPAPPPGRSHLVVFARDEAWKRAPLLVDSLTAEILSLSDGTHTAGDIAALLKRQDGHPPSKTLKWIEELFLSALLGLTQDGQRVAVAAAETGLRA